MKPNPQLFKLLVTSLTSATAGLALAQAAPPNAEPDSKFLVPSNTPYDFTMDSSLTSATTSLAPAQADPPNAEPDSVFLAPSKTPSLFALGRPDPNGPAYFRALRGPVRLPGPITLMGHTVSGTCANGPTNGACPNGLVLRPPHPDVSQAWRQGWTGKGKNILVIDAFVPLSAENDGRHGPAVMMIAMQTALGASNYGLESSLDRNGMFLDGIRFSSGERLINSNVKFDAINMSFGIPDNWTAKEAAIVSNNMVSVLNGRLRDGQYNLTDATIAKAAGNEHGRQAITERLNLALAAAPTTRPRLLIVGALEHDGSPSKRAKIADYSNHAGANRVMQSRFLVANGSSLVGGNADLAIDGKPLSLDEQGTSFAAPRVAAYAAIVRHKFPNLTGAQTADVLLQTARTDTLACSTTPQGCNPAIYGRGEASLSRALAPVGKLR